MKFKIIATTIAILLMLVIRTSEPSLAEAKGVIPTPILASTPSPSPLPNNTGPFVGAPLCLNHSTSEFHALWNSEQGCHYDHEHGTNPFTSQVDAVFSGIQNFLGGVQIGSTNPSSPTENTHKHGGFKWDVVLSVPCEIFEGAQWCVTAATIQYHAFGDYSIEMESRIHSTSAFIKACNPSNVNDCGLLYTTQHQEYGQRVSQYQGVILPYPNNFLPLYGSSFGPYFTIDRYGSCEGCRPSLQYVRDRNVNANSIWTSKRTGPGARPAGSTLFNLLFRVRDNYQLLEWASVADGYPFNFGWVCGTTVYNPVGCRWNNTTTRVHEIAGIVPSTWDNLAGFDTNPVVGRITAEGFTDRFGVLQPSCTVANESCFPVKLINMFVGKYGGALPGAKVSNPSPTSNPERDIYFCNGVACSEISPGAVPSGWVGKEN